MPNLALLSIDRSRYYHHNQLGLSFDLATSTLEYQFFCSCRTVFKINEEVKRKFNTYPYACEIERCTFVAKWTMKKITTSDGSDKIIIQTVFKFPRCCQICIVGIIPPFAIIETKQYQSAIHIKTTTIDMICTVSSLNCHSLWIITNNIICIFVICMFVILIRAIILILVIIFILFIN